MKLIHIFMTLIHIFYEADVYIFYLANAYFL